MGSYVCRVHFRADEWDVNKWAWEGVLKVISKGEECVIRLEDKNTGKNVFTYYRWRLYCIFTFITSNMKFQP